MGDNAPDQNESEEKNIKESKGTKVCINQKLQTVNKTRLSITNRQANLVPRFTC